MPLHFRHIAVTNALSIAGCGPLNSDGTKVV